VVTVSPNNPTGSYVKKTELARIAELGLPIISDEVFGPYSFGDDPERPRSALEAPGALVFALDGLSKAALLPQMKLAWITIGGSESSVVEAMGGLELLCDIYLSPNTAVQHALPVLLEASRTSQAELHRRLKQNFDFAGSRVRGSPVTALDAEGGWYAVLRVPNVRTEEEWVLGLLGDRDVLVQPGYFYDFDFGAHLVLSLMTPEATFRDGVSRLVDYVTLRA
jgi:aspartate/methionine/tyrosine aminotransferase